MGDRRISLIILLSSISLTTCLFALVGIAGVAGRVDEAIMTDSVEAGDSRAPMVWLNGMNTGPSPPSNVPGSASPYGLWGALGSKASKETIEEQLNQ